MNKKTLKLTRCAIIGALYIVLSYVTLPISGGAIQFRIAEGLTLLPLLYVESIISVFVGCFLFNLLSGLPFYDVLFGSIITLVAGALTYLTGRVIKNKGLNIFVGGLFPVLLNAFFLPVIWYYIYGKLEFAYLVSVLSLLISQALSVYLVGTLEITYLYKLKDKGIGFLAQ